MSVEQWSVFALFWFLFTVTPGPNAVNCIQNGMSHGFRRSLWGVLGILTQASLFMALSAAGITALIAASPALYFWIRLTGAAFLVWLGIRGWINARRPVSTGRATGGSIYLRALMIATINAKSVAGYLAAFTQFVAPDVPIWEQMRLIVPTALCITALNYSIFTALGVLMGRMALGAVMNVWFRRIMALCFIGYGLALGLSGAAPG